MLLAAWRPASSSAAASSEALASRVPSRVPSLLGVFRLAGGKSLETFRNPDLFEKRVPITDVLPESDNATIALSMQDFLIA